MNKQQLLLEEYRELCQSYRQDDNWFARFTTVAFLPSIYVLIAPYIHDEVPALLTCFIGFVGMTYWWASALNYHERADIRWGRIRQIELELTFDAHVRIDRKRRESKSLLSQIRHRHWRHLIYGIYFGLVALVCLHHAIIKC